MPQTDQETHDLITKWFGGIDDYPVIKFLESHGYEMTRDYHWKPPVSAHTINFIESVCIWFLISEWDFGGVKNADHNN